MDCKELISIILPVYNGEKYLAQSIESVLCQSYKNIELIIVNDCSTDSTEDIVLNFLKKDKRIKYINNKKNLKLPISLNVGFANASGDYYTWTSDDNYFEPHAIAKMMSFLENNKDIDMVCCDYRMINDKGDYLNVIRVSNDIICGNAIGACFLYTKEIAKKVGFYNPNLFLLEDYDYWLRIHDIGKIGVLHECLYNYRIHPNTLTSKRKEDVKIRVRNYQKTRVKIYRKNIKNKQKLFDFYDYYVSLYDGKIKRIIVRGHLILLTPSYLLYYIRRKMAS